MNNLFLRKFGKGFISGGSVSLLAALQANGCNVTDLKAFGLTILGGVASGIFHYLVALYFHAGESISS